MLFAAAAVVPEIPADPCIQMAGQLNNDCQCVVLDKNALRNALSGVDGVYAMIVEERPHLLAESAVFVSRHDVDQQRALIAAVEKVVAMPSYQARVLASAPDIAGFIPKAHSVFFGYDFHLSANGSQLIEINTNAGGALINAVVARTQTACCGITATPSPEQAFVEMFINEWRAERGNVPLTTIAIVDENPQGQYMLPEFLLFRQLFGQHQIQAVICDPSALTLDGDGLKVDGVVIDLVYNRLTDFAFSDPANQVLRAAYLASAVVVTPHPRAHALYADKRNLALLTDADALQELGVDAETRAILLAGIAHTAVVKPEAAETLWANRKQLFFKPAKGYGSKAAYRGDKLTQRVFAEILQQDYVAQQWVRPSERHLAVAGLATDFKLDLRHYVYQGQTQLLSARLYQGQTTNFRTPGGGFAQVLVVPCN